MNITGARVRQGCSRVKYIPGRPNDSGSPSMLFVDDPRLSFYAGSRTAGCIGFHED